MVYLAAVSVLDRSVPPDPNCSGPTSLNYLTKRPARFKPKIVLRQVRGVVKRFPNVRTVHYKSAPDPRDDLYTLSISRNNGVTGIAVEVVSPLNYDISHPPPPASGPRALPTRPSRQGSYFKHRIVLHIGNYHSTLGSVQVHAAAPHLVPVPFHALPTVWRDYLGHWNKQVDPQMQGCRIGPLIHAPSFEYILYLVTRHLHVCAAITTLRITCLYGQGEGVDLDKTGSTIHLFVPYSKLKPQSLQVLERRFPNL